MRRSWRMSCMNCVVWRSRVWYRQRRCIPFPLDLYGQAPLSRGEAAIAARQRYRQILNQAALAEPPPEPQADWGRPKSTPKRNLLRRLTEHAGDVLAFALGEGTLKGRVFGRDERCSAFLCAFSPHPPNPLLPQGEKGEFGRPDG